MAEGVEVPTVVGREECRRLRAASLDIIDGIEEILSEFEDFGSDHVSKQHLLRMITILRRDMHAFPLDKTNRWIGYIQGVCAAYNVLPVNEERDRVREIMIKHGCKVRHVKVV